MSNRLTMIMGQALVATSLMFTACGTDVELCEVVDHPLAQVKFEVDLENQSFERGDMLVLACKLTNRRESMILVDYKGDGKYLFNGFGTDDSQSITGVFDMPVGMYNFLAFMPKNETAPDETAPDETAPDETAPDETAPDETTSDEAFQISTDCIVFNIDKTRFKDIEIKNSGELNYSEQLWAEYKNDGGYVEPKGNPIYYSRISRMSITANDIVPCAFSPQRIMQTINFSFNIKKDIKNVKFKVSSVEAEITGVPGRFNLYNGHISTDVPTYSTKLETKDIKNDDFNKTLIKYNSSIEVPTLFNSESSSKKEGPGILKIKVFMDIDGETKVLQGWKNLYAEIAKAQLVNYTKDRRSVVMASTYRNIDIDINVNANGFTSGWWTIKEGE